jgi:restriction endonuclease Mrr
MTAPDYQSMMAPLLSVLADGSDQRWADVKDAAAAKLEVTDAERGLRRRIRDGL